MAFTSVAAIVSAVGSGTAAAISAGTVLAAVAEIGVAVSVVGAVTGNKDMLKVGAIMGVVGGVGSMISGAAGAAEAGAAGAGMSAGETGAMDMMGSVGTGLESGAGAAEAASATGAMDQMGSIGTGLEPAAATGTATPTGAMDMAGSSGTGMEPTAPAPTTTGIVQQAMPDATTVADNTAVSAPSGPNAPTTPADPNYMKTGFGTNTGTNGPPLPTNTFWDQFSGKMSDLGGWMEKNKTLTGGLLTVGGGALAGMQKQSQFDQQMALYQQRQNNLSATSSAPRPTGLINSQR